MKIARLGIARDPDFMYYVDGTGDVCAVRRSRGGEPSEKVVIATTGLVLDRARYIYYLDMDGDVSAKERQLAAQTLDATTKRSPKRSRPARATRSKRSRSSSRR